MKKQAIDFLPYHCSFNRLIITAPLSWSVKCAAWNQISNNPFYPVRGQRKPRHHVNNVSHDGLPSTCGYFSTCFLRRKQTDMTAGRDAGDQLSACTNKSGPRFLSKRQQKLNHADSVLTTNWRANWRLCAPHTKLRKPMTARNNVYTLLICFAKYHNPCLTFTKCLNGSVKRLWLSCCEHNYVREHYAA